ncbi:MAG: HD domain-containing protein [Nitrospiraceae bacterium]|nr:HD domain-containing protein [Nitrospiraceae bacterium]
MQRHVECDAHVDASSSPAFRSILSASEIIEMIVGAHPRSRDEVIRLIIRLMRDRDPQSHEHGERTALHAVALGHAVGFDKEDLIHLHTAALLHDLGRLTLPAAVVHKHGPLSAEEYALVQCHPRAGAEILTALPWLQTPAVWIAHHHERWDGSGYPYGLRGGFIPLGSRILAIADLFDAALSHQPLAGSARRHQYASGQLKIASGSQLDPELVGTFITLLSLPAGILGRCFTAFAQP